MTTAQRKQRIARDQLADIVPYTPEQFRALAKYKGWKFTMIAERWEKSADRVRKIAADPQRSIQWDDALRGLPNLGRFKRDTARLEKELGLAVARRESKKAAADAAAHKQLKPGYRYHGYFTIGAIIGASMEVGTVAEEGMRGVVFEVVDDGIQETYGVIFETGLWDWFTPTYVDTMLVTTGFTDEGTVSYQYVDEVSLQEAFDSGAFDFYPEIPGS